MEQRDGWSELFATAFERSRNAMLLTDGQRVVVDTNAAFLTLLGRRRDAVIGKPMYAFVAGGPLATSEEMGRSAGRRPVLRRGSAPGCAQAASRRPVGGQHRDRHRAEAGPLRDLERLAVGIALPAHREPGFAAERADAAPAGDRAPPGARRGRAGDRRRAADLARDGEDARPQRHGQGRRPLRAHLSPSRSATASRSPEPPRLRRPYGRVRRRRLRYAPRASRRRSRSGGRRSAAPRRATRRYCVSRTTGWRARVRFNRRPAMATVAPIPRRTASAGSHGTSPVNQAMHARPRSARTPRPAAVPTDAAAKRYRSWRRLASSASL